VERKVERRSGQGGELKKIWADQHELSMRAVETFAGGEGTYRYGGDTQLVVVCTPGVDVLRM
jgi:hypothetical protein